MELVEDAAIPQETSNAAIALDDQVIIRESTEVEASEEAESVEDGAECKTSVSGHSRQKKNLCNLKKAVVKWQKRVTSGTMTQSELVMQILASPAAVHLQSTHGSHFRSEEFVGSALRCSRRA